MKCFKSIKLNIIEITKRLHRKPEIERCCLNERLLSSLEHVHEFF